MILSDEEKAAALEIIVHNPGFLEIARRAIEDELIERRDRGISVLRANGLCVRSIDGSPSSIIRMTNEEAIVYGLNAIVKKLRGT